MSTIDFQNEIQSIITKSNKSFPMILVFSNGSESKSMVLYDEGDLEVKMGKIIEIVGTVDLLKWINEQNAFYESNSMCPGVQSLEGFPMYFFWAKVDDPNVRLRKTITSYNFAEHHCVPNMGDYGWKKRQLIDFVFDVMLSEAISNEKLLESYRKTRYYRERLLPFFKKEYLCLMIQDYIKNNSILLMGDFLNVLEHEHDAFRKQLREKLKKGIDEIMREKTTFKYNWQRICKVLDRTFERNTLNKLAMDQDIDNPQLLSKRELCVELAKKLQETILKKQESLPMCNNTVSLIGQDDVKDIPEEFFLTYTERDPVTHKDFVYCFDIRELYDLLKYQKEPYLNPYTKREFKVNPEDNDGNSKEFYKMVKKEYFKLKEALSKKIDN